MCHELGHGSTIPCCPAGLDAETRCHRFCRSDDPAGRSVRRSRAARRPLAEGLGHRPLLGLDDACRRQQLGEGWFPTFDDVPNRAISMSIQQIMKSQSIVCSVPDRRKAEAVRNSLKGPVTPDVPASILQKHANVTVYLDRESAALL